MTRERVRQTLRACDPINTNLRWSGIVTPRQPYSVPGPIHCGMLTVTTSLFAGGWYAMVELTDTAG